MSRGMKKGCLATWVLPILLPMLLAVLCLFATPLWAGRGAMPEPDYNAAASMDDLFSRWREGLIAEAVAQGLSEATVRDALYGLTPDESVLSRDRRQPETTLGAATYWQKIITPSRIRAGQVFYQNNQAILDQVGAMYGVPPRFIVALIGIESNYGVLQGKNDIIRSLATLAFDGRRAAFFRKELLFALQMLDEGAVLREDLVGSWAGAMGYCQFMPSSFIQYAQSFYGNRRKDIWHDVGDAAASTANYLHQNNWHGEESWGSEVQLTQALPATFLGLAVVKPVEAWQGLGVRFLQADPSFSPARNASLIQPDGGDGRTFLVYDNFRIIMRWNHSTYFATAVGMLADSL